MLKIQSPSFKGIETITRQTSAESDLKFLTRQIEKFKTSPDQFTRSEAWSENGNFVNVTINDKSGNMMYITKDDSFIKVKQTSKDSKGSISRSLSSDEALSGNSQKKISDNIKNLWNAIISLKEGK